MLLNTFDSSSIHLLPHDIINLFAFASRETQNRSWEISRFSHTAQTTTGFRATRKIRGKMLYCDFPFHRLRSPGRSYNVEAQSSIIPDTWNPFKIYTAVSYIPRPCHDPPCPLTYARTFPPLFQISIAEPLSKSATGIDIST